jgi:Collagen triple helix repeat (20 copies)
MRTRTIGRGVLAAALATTVSSAAVAGVPQTITHQGRLYDASNELVSGTLAVQFAIYAGPTTTTSLWTETDMIAFDEGYFSVSLGQATPFGAGLFDGAVLYMGITVGTDPEMTPRAPVQSVPYAMVAGDAIGDIHPTSVSVGGMTVIDSGGQWVGSTAGLQGPMGPAGPAGAQGSQGNPGPIGPTGAAGAVGAVGPQGAAGALGPTGPQGPQGPAGAAGSVGPQGAAGALGAQGVPGAQGPPGNQYGEFAAAFIGFTSTTTLGNLGSREQAHAFCAAQYAGSHLCHFVEYELAAPATTPPAGGAWLDSSTYPGTGSTVVDSDTASFLAGRYVGVNAGCQNWTALTNGSGQTLQATTVAPSGLTSTNCTVAHALACCVSPFLEKFAGLSAPTLGNPGSREQMHALCGAAYAGSHMCHFSEYYRTQNTTSLPAGGAWIDGSTALGGTSTIADSDTAAWAVGRYVGVNAGCQNWTALTNGSGQTLQGEIVTPSGTASTNCSVAHPIACCE